MEKIYISPIIEIIKFGEENILTDSIVAGNPFQPGDTTIDGSEFFK